MESKVEKIALFRYGLIAPLVLEPLPRGELTRRARRLPPVARRFPARSELPSRSIPCSIGHSAIVPGASKP